MLAEREPRSIFRRDPTPTSITLLTKFQVSALARGKAGESMSRNLVLSLRSSPTEGLPLPSLLGLCSLKVLNLSDYNLLEGAYLVILAPCLHWND